MIPQNPISNNSAFPVRNEIPARNFTSTAASLATKEAFHAAWDAWEKEAEPGAGEHRNVAVVRMKDCLERRATELDLEGLSLRTLPAIMPRCVSLFVGHNQLTGLPELHEGLERLSIQSNPLEHLPDRLPASLRDLDANLCALTQLPATLPDNLTLLVADGNQLTELPENLPNGLQWLVVANNQLTELPKNLPNGLTNLLATNNQLTELPENLPNGLIGLFVGDNVLTELPATLPPRLGCLDVKGNRLISLSEAIFRLPQESQVHVEGNPLSEPVRSRLQDLASDPDYQGPRIYFSMSTGSNSAPTLPLSEIVASFVLPDQKNEIVEKWDTIAKEDNAAAFGEFLNRLADTESAKKEPAFKQQIATWLAHMTDRPSLREQIFLIAQGATASCEDRVSLTYNEMQKAVVVHDVEGGKYDAQLPELVELGREMFRQEQLEQIARNKVTTLKLVDEIEVYLAYQVKLRESLRLTGVTKEMRFSDVSGVTQDDLDSATLLVKSRENENFPSWLSQWSPWKTVLHRIDTSRYEAAIKKREDALAGPYDAQIDAELKELGLEHDEDAVRTIGKKVLDQIMSDIDMTLTKEVLSEKKSLALLDKRWSI
ncbi:hypothetical protein KDW36_14975 [Burkholderia dolosa]|uniref:NEL-type E3 ubiquitin ligase domain-containing protein n=1 Tax=Burkholderia dolosa TaxID=152500 RepID=UPI001B8F5E72|nr:NEL-type E3 ubiquitin ligase domain-containing protein [Burkholderia dolosa]MBR8314491.1 hypothetical protein [Burkholderia dolosa]